MLQSHTLIWKHSKKFGSKILRAVLDASSYNPNIVIVRVLQVSSIKEEIRSSVGSYLERFMKLPNISEPRLFASDSASEMRRLNRFKPDDLSRFMPL